MPEAEQEPQPRQFTMAEVREARSKSSRTLVVIYDKVYDVSGFLNEHPGGEEVLIDQAGKDATEDFQDVGHSTDAIQLMSKYEVGELVAAERKNRPSKPGWTAGASSLTPEKDKYAGAPGLPFGLLAAASLAAVLAVVYLFVL